MKVNPVRIYVAPEFKKTLKLCAASNNKPVLEFTREISNMNNFNDFIKKWKERKKNDKYDFF